MKTMPFLLLCAAGFLALPCVMAEDAPVKTFVGKLIISPSPSRTETKEMPHPFNLYGTHVEILRSAEIKQRTELKLRTKHPEMEPREVKVTASHPEGTALVVVSGEGSDADYTRAYVDALMDEYRAYIREAGEKELGGVLNKVIEEVLSREKQVKEKFAKLNEYLQKSDQAFLEGDRNRAVEYMDRLRDNLNHYHTELSMMEKLKMDDYLSSKASVATAREGFGMDLAFGGFSRSEKDYLEGLNEIKLLQARRLTTLKNTKETHEAVKDIDEKIATQQSLNEINRQASTENWARRIAGLKLKIASFEQQITENAFRAREANEKIVQHQIFKGDYERSLNDYKDWKKTLDRIDGSAVLNLPAIPVILERATLATAD